MPEVDHATELPSVEAVEQMLQQAAPVPNSPPGEVVPNAGPVIRDESAAQAWNRAKMTGNQGSNATLANQPKIATSRMATGNISGAFRGTWTPSGPTELFTSTTGSILHQIKSWKTNVSKLLYLQSALLLRDGVYSTAHDTRLSFEGVFDRQTATAFMFSRKGSQSVAASAALNLSADARAWLVLINQARAAAQRMDRHFRDQWFSSSFTNSKCAFYLTLRLEGLPEGAGPSDQPAPTPGHRLQLAGSLTSLERHVKADVTLKESSLNYDEYYSQAFYYTVLTTLLSCGQIALFIRQMEFSQTQAAIARVSALTVAFQAGMDAFFCLMHLTTGIIVEALFNAFALCAFCKFVLFSMFELRFFVMVCRSQNADTDPDRERREVSLLYSRFYGVLITVVLIGYQFPDLIQLLVFLSFSFWIPQIVQNAVRDSNRPAFSTRYIIGMTCTRVFIPLYLYGYPANYLHLKPAPAYCFYLVVYIGGQAAILLAQQRYGSRTVLPKALLPKKYDYYRRLEPRPPSVVDAEQAVGACQADICPICMAGIEDLETGCMVTPCDHVFHDECLQQWMDIKMECPTCRAALP
jgi:hypothetical protein